MSRPASPWKWLSGFLLSLIIIVLVFNLASRRRVDDRLLGSWQSDRERTVEEIRQTRRLDEKQLAALSALFGKLKITYTASTYMSELDGVTEEMPYDVLGSDRTSVVIRDLQRREPDLELTAFGVIHFEGPDAYWLYTKIGGFREFFRKVPSGN